MTYSVVVEENGSKTYQATVLGWPNCSVAGATREEALAKLRGVVQRRIARAEIVKLDVETPNEHPWLGLAHSLGDNPLFDEVLEHIEAYRRELDADEEAV